MISFVYFLIIYLNLNGLHECICEENENKYKMPTVGISVLVRNKAHTLPYFLTCIKNLDYPKDRVYVW